MPGSRGKRIVMYVPHVTADSARAYLVETAESLASAVAAAGWQLTVLARPTDLAGMPIPWPAAVLEPLRAVVSGTVEPNGMPPSLEQDFTQLIFETQPFDVLYLPSPWGCLPSNHRTVLPAPIVVGFGDLPFERVDFGARTDRFRREMRRLFQLASTFVFDSDTARHELKKRYAIDPGAAHVIRCDSPGESHSASAGEQLLAVFERVLESPWLTRPKATYTRSVPRENRIAWLINHTTLRDAEADLLQSLGYEVFTSKVLLSGEDFRSGTHDFSWDQDSTLPTPVLDYLNCFNFYQTPFDGEMADVLNGYFGTVICAAFPALIRQLARYFRGRIVVRLFGREQPNNYTDYIDLFHEGWLWKRLWQIQHRFWLGVCYESIPLIEAPLLRRRSVFLPVGLPDRVLRMAGCWRGGDKRVLFVCPSIKTSPQYYGAIYERFKARYGEFPHVIAGAQPIPVADPHVTGFVTEDQLLRFYRELRVMYYHSREPRHIHYHPLEAIAYGMPVVYMRGGLMESFDKGSQAGACHTDAEARRKILRILQGDQGLIREIQDSQGSILETFSPAGTRAQWKRAFVNGIMSTPIASPGVCA
jgi:hypothetical protein